VPLDPRLTPIRPDISAIKPYFAQITLPVAPLFKLPQAGLGLESQLLHGETVQVHGLSNGFALVQNEYDNYVGFTPLTAIGTLSPTLKVGALATFIYAEPSIKSSVLLSLPFGALIEGENQGEFIKTNAGYIFAKHCLDINHNAQDYVEIALSFMNVPYLWGGKSAFGLDCSALIQTALRACGMQAPRDSDQQFSDLGETKALSDISRGDLVFWKGHIGLMASDTHLLHANGNGMQVELEDLRVASARIAARGGGEITGVKGVNFNPVS
jgi:cell wall-associated NlpC family hydrolase